MSWCFTVCIFDVENYSNLNHFEVITLTEGFKCWKCSVFPCLDYLQFDIKPLCNPQHNLKSQRSETDTRNLLVNKKSIIPNLAIWFMWSLTTHIPQFLSATDGLFWACIHLPLLNWVWFCHILSWVELSRALLRGCALSWEHHSVSQAPK